VCAFVDSSTTASVRGACVPASASVPRRSPGKRSTGALAVAGSPS
jgi:hypothetical protein